MKQIDDDKQKYQKSSKKKYWVLKFKLKEDSKNIDEIVPLFLNLPDKTYVTKKAAQDAKTAWENGCGIDYKLRPPSQWTAEVVPKG